MPIKALDWSRRTARCGGQNGETFRHVRSAETTETRGEKDVCPTAYRYGGHRLGLFFFFSILLASLLFRTLSTQTSYMLAPLFYCVGLPRQCRSTFRAPLKSMCASLAIDSSTPTLPPYFYSWKTVKHLRARVRARTGSAVRTKELG